MDNGKLIIALHTSAHAQRLARLLEKEGIEVSITKVDLDTKLTDMPVAMEIDVHDMASALRIIENLEIFRLDGEDDLPAAKVKKTAKDLFKGKKASPKSNKPVILLPVDFSDYSFLAARFAFPLAKKHNARIVLIHAYVIPSRADNLSFTPETLAFEPQDMELDLTLEETAKEQMKSFTARLRDYIKEGIIPPVKFDVEILEGLPETVINDYSRDVDPMLIVMGTRGANKKERELVGSITAEVLDTVRFPVFTVPETNRNSLASLRQVAFFCNLDNDDLTALNTLSRLFPDEQFNITFYHISSRKDKLTFFSPDSSLKKLTNYCRTKFRGYTFDAKELSPDGAKDLFQAQKLADVSFIVIPNKRRHALARLFNPGLAHRLLFHVDIPMMAIPV